MAVIPAAKERKPATGWDGPYSPFRLGMAFKEACAELRTKGLTPSQNVNAVVSAAIELYSAVLKAEREVIRLHEPNPADQGNYSGEDA